MGPHVAQSDVERSARQQHLQQAEADFEVLPFDAEVRGHLGASLPRCVRRANQPREPTTRHYTASAVAHGVPLYTCIPVTSLGYPS